MTTRLGTSRTSVCGSVSSELEFEGCKAIPEIEHKSEGEFQLPQGNKQKRFKRERRPTPIPFTGTLFKEPDLPLGFDMKAIQRVEEREISLSNSCGGSGKQTMSWRSVSSFNASNCVDILQTVPEE